jgi:hypothetical protein
MILKRVSKQLHNECKIINTRTENDRNKLVSSYDYGNMDMWSNRYDIFQETVLVIVLGLRFLWE